MIRRKSDTRRKLRTGRSTGKPTRAEEIRFIAMKFDGCICCRMRGLGNVEPDIHHLKSGNIRRGHRFTIALCPWHHRGQPFAWLTHEQCRERFGPSLAEGARVFHEAFGSDDELLAYQEARFSAPGEVRLG